MSYYTFRHKFTREESGHYRTVGAAKGALTAHLKWNRNTRADYEIVTYECKEVAVTQLH